MKLCLVIPCYNEASRLKTDLFLDYADRNPSTSFVFVNDGSSDNTLECLKALEKHPNLFVHDLDKNGGKAHAVRQGFLYAQAMDFDLIGFWDADLATPLSEIKSFLPFFSENKQCQCVIGSRLKRLGSQIERKWYRHILGRIFATVASLMLGLHIYVNKFGA
jgi:dolichyl-phosphate beta-glucosyltransferase